MLDHRQLAQAIPPIKVARAQPSRFQLTNKPKPLSVFPQRSAVSRRSTPEIAG